MSIIRCKGQLVIKAVVHRHIQFSQHMDFQNHKGWLQLGIDYADDPMTGELTVAKVSPFEMREDPDAKEYDLNRTGRFVIRDEWMDRVLSKDSQQQSED